MCAQILYMISANGTRQIHIVAGKQKIVWSRWYKQPATKIVIAIIIDSLIYVFNLCIEKKVFPSELKKAKVVPLPKSTDKTNPNPTSYRPVLLSVLSKLLEKHVHIYLNDYLEKRQLLHPFQSRFRPKYSCNTALCVI